MLIKTFEKKKSINTRILFFVFHRYVKINKFKIKISFKVIKYIIIFVKNKIWHQLVYKDILLKKEF